MNRYMKIALAFGVLTVLGASAAYAQATRTWVSGVGDDVNPCSRTAPCKTFAGAISKTAAGGEISVLDPGGFGAVTITKSITINGEGTLGHILGAGANAININDSATPTPGTIFVTLRYLTLNGAGSGLSGINFTSGAGVVVEHVTILGFQNGIRTTVGNTTVKDSTIARNVSFGARAIGGSITFENTLFSNNAIAVQTDAAGTIRLSNSSFYNNGLAFACAPGGTLASTGNNRKANNVGGVVTSPAAPCVPNFVTVVQ
jgi:hypothetical protein